MNHTINEFDDAGTRKLTQNVHCDTYFSEIPGNKAVITGHLGKAAGGYDSKAYCNGMEVVYLDAYSIHEENITEVEPQFSKQRDGSALTKLQSPDIVQHKLYILAETIRVLISLSASQWNLRLALTFARKICHQLFLLANITKLSLIIIARAQSWPKETRHI